eukprot:2917040-Amphidinium_carterae.1
MFYEQIRRIIKEDVDQQRKRRSMFFVGFYIQQRMLASLFRALTFGSLNLLGTWPAASKKAWKLGKLQLALVPCHSGNHHMFAHTFVRTKSCFLSEKAKRLRVLHKEAQR